MQSLVICYYKVVMEDDSMAVFSDLYIEFNKIYAIQIGRAHV